MLHSYLTGLTIMRYFFAITVPVSLKFTYKIWLLIILSSTASGFIRTSDMELPNRYVQYEPVNVDPLSGSGSQSIGNMITQELVVNRKEGFKFMCKFLTNLEKLIEGPDLRQLLHNINLKVAPTLCYNLGDIASLPDIDTRDLTTSDIEELVAQEIMNNIKVQGFICVMFEKLLSIVKTQELKEYLKKIYDNVLEALCSESGLSVIKEEFNSILYNATDLDTQSATYVDEVTPNHIVDTDSGSIRTDSDESQNTHQHFYFGAYSYSNVLQDYLLEEVKVNMLELIKFSCTVFNDLEKIVEGDEIKSVLKMIVTKLESVVCKDPEKFVSYVPDNLSGMNTEELRARKMQDFANIFGIGSDNVMYNIQNDNQNSGLITLLARETISNPKLHEYLCDMLKILISILKTEKLKHYLEAYYQQYIEHQCRRPDIPRTKQTLHEIYNFRDSSDPDPNTLSELEKNLMALLLIKRYFYF